MLDPSCLWYLVSIIKVNVLRVPFVITRHFKMLACFNFFFSLKLMKLFMVNWITCNFLTDTLTWKHFFVPTLWWDSFSSLFRNLNNVCIYLFWVLHIIVRGVIRNTNSTCIQLNIPSTCFFISPEGSSGDLVWKIENAKTLPAFISTLLFFWAPFRWVSHI